MGPSIQAREAGVNMGLSRYVGGDRLGEFGILFASLLALMVLPELLPDEGAVRWQLPLFFSLVMLSALTTVSRRRREMIIAGSLLVLALLPQWIGAFGAAGVGSVGRIPLALFLIYVCGLILRMVLSARTVDLEVILAALCVYLLLALIWAIVYHLIEIYQPGAFSIPVALLEGKANPDQAISAALHYFSFVTITTLGYGDVTPVAPLARSMAMLEAVVGQIYLVTLIARLVSMETFQAEDEARAERD